MKKVFLPMKYLFSIWMSNISSKCISKIEILYFLEWHYLDTIWKFFDPKSRQMQIGEEND